MSEMAIDVIVEEHLKPGAKVEVRSRFDGRWSRGFEVAEVLAHGYRVRRLSDGALLPSEFDDDEIRAEKRRNMWWV